MKKVFEFLPAASFFLGDEGLTEVEVNFRRTQLKNSTSVTAEVLKSTKDENLYDQEMVVMGQAMSNTTLVKASPIFTQEEVKKLIDENSSKDSDNALLNQGLHMKLLLKDAILTATKEKVLLISGKEKIPETIEHIPQPKLKTISSTHAWYLQDGEKLIQSLSADAISILTKEEIVECIGAFAKVQSVGNYVLTTRSFCRLIPFLREQLPEVRVVHGSTAVQQITQKPAYNPEEWTEFINQQVEDHRTLQKNYNSKVAAIKEKLRNLERQFIETYEKEKREYDTKVLEHRQKLDEQDRFIAAEVTKYLNEAAALKILEIKQ